MWEPVMVRKEEFGRNTKHKVGRRVQGAERLGKIRGVEMIREREARKQRE
jgi:hypothetical protein